MARNISYMDGEGGGLPSWYSSAPTGYAPQAQAAATPTAQITSQTQGLSAGQQQAYAGLEHYQGTTANDWIPNEQYYGGATGLDAWLAADPTLSALASAGDGVDQSTYNKAKQDAITKYQGHSNAENGATVRQGIIDDTQKSVNWWNAHPNGNDDWMDKLMETAMPLIVGGIVGGGVLGLYGEGAAGAASGLGGAGAGGAAAGGDVALGSLPTSGFGLDSLGWADGLGGAGAGGAAGTGGLGGAGAGLGSMIGVEGGAPAVVTIGAPAATGGTGLLGAGAGVVGAGALGLDNILGHNPQLPVDSSIGNLPNIQNPDPMGLGTKLPIPPIGLPNLNQGGGTPSGTGGTPGATTPGGTSGIPGGIGGLPGNIGGIIGGIGDIIGGNVDHIKNQQDQTYWQNYMDKLTGMYMPGTPEAEMMRHKMEAQDAAAGRNSQYGVREMNLGALLNDKRAQIMSSPAFYNMGAAARGHYDNSLNSLFGALGKNTSGGSNALGSLLNMGGNWLGGMFNSTPSNQTYANNDWLTS